ncbi:SRPBCC domain-containing protein [Brachybacterium sp. YJGR34]|uniref:SRPBCC domain-containing protein n=1 Tax=Brachybacterium sp. YJGR34 TaxID=2059911 RepID=UPI000E0BB969|nr:SRPBCC domain-containing protein [Brachybacterium sp. YJGR34]
MTVTESLPVVDAVRRELEIEEQVREGRPLLRVSLTLATNLTLAPAQLWPLLTRAEQLGRWYGPVTGDLREGGRFRAPDGAEGEILEVEEPHRIALHWIRHDLVEPFQLRLDPEDDGTTRLRLVRTALVDRAEFDRAGPGALAMPWEIALLALAAHTGGWRAGCLLDAPAPTRDWLRSTEGAAVVRAWSVRWAAQSVAAGVDEAAARRGEVEAARRQLGV